MPKDEKMDVKYQVFISSTFVDLKEERRAAIESILNLGHFPIGMELFQAGDDTQWNYIKRRIDECDYYLVILAERYGSEVRGKSYTQMEYEYALKSKKPVAAFLLHTEARRIWEQDRVEFNKKTKIEAFRKLCERKLVKYWHNADDLALKIATTLFELTREKPQVGWVKADSVPSTGVLTEIARLSEEKRQLQDRLEALGAGEKITVPAEAKWHLDTLRAKRATNYLEFEQGAKLEVSLLALFVGLSRHLAAGATVWTAGEIIKSTFGIKLERPTDGAGYLLRELTTHAALEVRASPTASGGVAHRYYLTDYGKRLIMYAEVGGYVASEFTEVEQAIPPTLRTNDD